ncbi:MAG: synthase, complex, delta subunit [Pseudomonadota bacterium]
MINPLSKRYSKALIESYKGDSAKLQAAYDSLLKINQAFSIGKFRDIQSLGNVDKNAKAELIKAVADNNDEYFQRFLVLLINEGRLTLSDAIAEEVRLFLTSKSGVYSGVCYSTFEISENDRNQIAQAVSTKVGKKIELHGDTLSKTNEFDGIKVEIKDLNIEVKLNKPAIAKELIASVLQQIQLKSF